MDFLHSRSLRPPLKSQSGAVLIIGLIMVLLMTIVGLAAIRGSSLQEMMASNLRDRNLAFQAAEAGLRAGESRVGLINDSARPAFDGTAGLHPDLNQPNKTPVIQWGTTEWTNDSVLTAMSLDVASQPRYVVEELIVSALDAAAADDSGVDLASIEGSYLPEFYRVSSRGVGGTTDADVVVQSVYKR